MNLYEDKLKIKAKWQDLNPHSQESFLCMFACQFYKVPMQTYNTGTFIPFDKLPIKAVIKLKAILGINDPVSTKVKDEEEEPEEESEVYEETEGYESEEENNEYESEEPEEPEESEGPKIIAKSASKIISKSKNDQDQIKKTSPSKQKQKQKQIITPAPQVKKNHKPQNKKEISSESYESNS